MKKFLRIMLLLALFFGIIEPVAAVFEERDLTQTLRVLKVELRRAHRRTAMASQMIKATRQSQQKQMVELMEDCNELAIILYSQKQNFTFDLTYALEEVSDRYRDFSRNRRPFNEIINQIDIEIERYQKLIYTLKRLPPALIDNLDSLGGNDSTFILASQLQEEVKNLHQKNSGEFSLKDRPGRHKIREKEQQPEPAPKPEITPAPQGGDAENSTDSLKGSAGNILRSLAKTIFTGSVDHSEEEEEDDYYYYNNTPSDTSLNSTIVAVTSSGDVMDGHSTDSTIAAQEVEYAFLLTGKSLINRDSCIYYAEGLLNMYEASKASIVTDSVNYDATWRQLQEAYNYAQGRYNDVQKKIFIDGQNGYYSILARFPRFWSRAKNDLRDKWAAANTKGLRSQWRLQTMIGLILFVLFYLGIAILLSHLIVRLLKKKVKYLQSERFKQHGICFILLFIVIIFAVMITVAMMFSNQNFLKLATRLLVEFAWLLAAIFLSFAIRLKGDQVKSSIRSYLPIMVLCLIIIFIRISFSPNTLINIILPPLLLLFTIWQWRICRKMKYSSNSDDTKKTGIITRRQKRRVAELEEGSEKRNRRIFRVQFADYIYNYITLTVFVVTTILSLSGYVLLSILIIIWWIFQLSIIQTITAASDLLKIYYERYMAKRLRAYRINHGFLINPKVKSSYIEVTWLYDIFRKAVIPFFTVWSIPLCLYMASNVFDLSSVTVSYLKTDFLNYNVIHLSATKILTAISLAFVFGCLGYLAKAFYRVFKIRSVLARTGQKELPENMINFTLANSIISILTWGAYIITCFLLLHIPSTAISIVSAGLATGVGFALKDVINNFFYGVSLMSGRLRVGDYVECDGVRGIVDSINYQSTLIETEYGSIMAFPNANLFQKNFKNLTRNNAYELLILPVGIQYGSDIAKVRDLLKRALIKLNVKDKYGRNVLNPKYGIVVRLAEFGDSSLVLKVYQQVLVTERYTYTAAANETIYNTLNENNITIPFPQQDIYIKQVLQDKAKEEDAEAEESNPHPDKKKKWFL